MSGDTTGNQARVPSKLPISAVALAVSSQDYLALISKAPAVVVTGLHGLDWTGTREALSETCQGMKGIVSAVIPDTTINDFAVLYFTDVGHASYALAVLQEHPPTLGRIVQIDAPQFLLSPPQKASDSRNEEIPSFPLVASLPASTAVSSTLAVAVAAAIATAVAGHSLVVTGLNGLDWANTRQALEQRFSGATDYVGVVMPDPCTNDFAVVRFASRQAAQAVLASVSDTPMSLLNRDRIALVDPVQLVPTHPALRMARIAKPSAAPKKTTIWVIIENQGSVYYHNPASGQTRWDRPQEPGAVVSPWRQYCTPEGRAYWHNTTTGQTTWENPLPPMEDVEEKKVGAPTTVRVVRQIKPRMRGGKLLKGKEEGESKTGDQSGSVPMSQIPPHIPDVIELPHPKQEEEKKEPPKVPLIKSEDSVLTDCLDPVMCSFPIRGFSPEPHFGVVYRLLGPGESKIKELCEEVGGDCQIQIAGRGSAFYNPDDMVWLSLEGVTVCAADMLPTRGSQQGFRSAAPSQPVFCREFKRGFCPRGTLCTSLHPYILLPARDLLPPLYFSIQCAGVAALHKAIKLVTKRIDEVKLEYEEYKSVPFVTATVPLRMFENCPTHFGAVFRLTGRDRSHLEGICRRVGHDCSLQIKGRYSAWYDPDNNPPVQGITASDVYPTVGSARVYSSVDSKPKAILCTAFCTGGCAKADTCAMLHPYSALSKAQIARLPPLHCAVQCRGMEALSLAITLLIRRSEAVSRDFQLWQQYQQQFAPTSPTTPANTEPTPNGDTNSTEQPAGGVHQHQVSDDSGSEKLAPTSTKRPLEDSQEPAAKRGQTAANNEARDKAAAVRSLSSTMPAHLRGKEEPASKSSDWHSKARITHGGESPGGSPRSHASDRDRDGGRRREPSAESRDGRKGRRRSRDRRSRDRKRSRDRRRSSSRERTRRRSSPARSRSHDRHNRTSGRWNNRGSGSSGGGYQGRGSRGGGRSTGGGWRERQAAEWARRQESKKGGSRERPASTSRDAHHSRSRSPVASPRRRSTSRQKPKRPSPTSSRSSSPRLSLPPLLSPPRPRSPIRADKGSRKPGTVAQGSFERPTTRGGRPVFDDRLDEGRRPVSPLASAPSSSLTSLSHLDRQGLERYRIMQFKPFTLTQERAAVHALLEDAMVKSVIVSLCDPTNSVRIVTPAKGVNCLHVECFDLDTYLTRCHNHETYPAWHPLAEKPGRRCMTCDQPLTPPTGLDTSNQVYVSPFFESLLKGAKPKHTAVELFVDMTVRYLDQDQVSSLHKPILDKPSAAKSRALAAEDGESVIPTRRSALSGASKRGEEVREADADVPKTAKRGRRYLQEAERSPVVPEVEEVKRKPDSQLVKPKAAIQASAGFPYPDWVATPTRAFHFKVSKRGVAVGEYFVDKHPYYIFGRDESLCDFFLEHPSVSRAHFALACAPNNQWFIIDLRSGKGTTVNGIPCPPAQPVPLQVGDHVIVANSTRIYTFQCAGDHAQVPGSTQSVDTTSQLGRASQAAIHLYQIYLRCAPKDQARVYGLRTVKEAAKELRQLRESLLQITDTEDRTIEFTVLSRKLSECEPSARNLGLVEPGTLEESLDQVAFSLEKGEISEVLQTSEGVRLLMRMA